MATDVPEAAVITHLRADADTAAVFEARVYRTTAPTSAGFPRAIVQRIGGQHHRHMGGCNALAEAFLQVDCQGAGKTGQADADAGAWAVREALDGFSHDTLGVPPNTVTAKGVFLEPLPDDYTPPTDRGVQGIFTRRWNVRLVYDQSVPSHD